jgi:ABC-2 type transport system ATP-binding protein
VHGTVEPLLKVLAVAGVHELLSREQSLEELFLAHYGTSTDTEGVTASAG